MEICQKVVRNDEATKIVQIWCVNATSKLPDLAPIYVPGPCWGKIRGTAQ